MRTLTLFIIFICAQQVCAQQASATLQEKLNAIRTMSATFSQEIKTKDRDLSSSSGVMALERPGKFRWDTKEPMAQLVIADGTKLWVYDKELEQVTVKKQEKGIGGTAGLFLSGYDSTVARDFEVKDESKGNQVIFELQAKSKQENVQRLKLTFVQDALKRMDMYDQLGQHTIVNLTQIKLNPKLSSAIFRFKVPKGVDVVEQ